MKKSKISFLSIFAIMIALVASSFTSLSPKGMKYEDTTFWFRYMGPTQTLTDLQDHTNYEYVDGQAGCSGSEDICSVKAEGSEVPESNPDAFSQELLEKIADVVSNTEEYPSEIAQEEE